MKIGECIERWLGGKLEQETTSKADRSGQTGIKCFNLL